MPMPLATRRATTIGPQGLFRIGIGLVGASILGYAIFGIFASLPPMQLIGLAAWLVMAILLHDGVLIPVISLSGRGISRLTHGRRPALQGLVRGALLVGVIMSTLVALLLRAQGELQPEGVGSGENDTIHQSDYALALGILWLILLGTITVALAALGRHKHRSKTSESQH